VPEAAPEVGPQHPPPAGELGQEAKKSLQLLAPPLDRRLMHHHTTQPADARHRAARTTTAR
jgi:hypothetical protein